MKAEYELRILEIQQEDFINKLKELGSEYIGSWEQKRYVYDMKPKKDKKWIRLRTNGEETTLTIKDIQSQTIDGTKELEIIVSDFDQTNKILEELGYHARAVQENKRTRYMLDNVEIDIDTWPHIPTYVEIEGKDEQEILKILNKLEISIEYTTTLDVESIYQHYGFSKEKLNILKFEKTENIN